MSAEDITEWLRSEPRKFDESHPLPNAPSMKWDSGIEQAKNIKVSVADFGQGIDAIASSYTAQSDRT